MTNLYPNLRKKCRSSRLLGISPEKNAAEEHLEDMDKLIGQLETAADSEKQSALVKEIIQIGQEALAYDSARMQVIQRYIRIKPYLNEKEQRKVFLNTVIR